MFEADLGEISYGQNESLCGYSRLKIFLAIFLQPVDQGSSEETVSQFLFYVSM